MTKPEGVSCNMVRINKYTNKVKHVKKFICFFTPEDIERQYNAKIAYMSLEGINSPEFYKVVPRVTGAVMYTYHRTAIIPILKRIKDLLSTRYVVGPVARIRLRRLLIL